MAAHGFLHLLSPQANNSPNTFARKQQGCCRFIPARNSMDIDVANFMLAKENQASNDSSPSKESMEYKKQLAENLLKDSNIIQTPQSRILAFKQKPPVSDAFEKDTKLLYSENHSTYPKRSKTFRHIPQSAERTLDAPDLSDDYYVNLLDWSTTNVVAVALGSAVYLWHASTGSIQELMQVGDEDGPVTSVSWAPDGKFIAIGLDNSEVQLWDTQSLRQLRSMKGHSDRVGSLSWNGPVVSSGSRDGVIFNHDVRIRDHITCKMASHEQEVCGLKWAPSGQQLASGGNDNMAYIWDARTMSSGGVSPFFHRLDEHQAAVKALAWCPFQSNLLASGGGTADRCIKFWNTTTGACLNSIDTNSQVCALQWSCHEKEILSSHGFSQNQLCLWKYPSMVKMAELTGHTARVLHLAQSPDGYTVASAAGDETLRFWQAFGAPENKPSIRGSSNLKDSRSSSLNSNSHCYLR